MDIDDVLKQFVGDTPETVDLDAVVAESRAAMHKFTDEACGPVLVSAWQAIDGMQGAHRSIPELKRILGDKLTPISVLALMMDSWADAAMEMNRVLHGPKPEDMMAFRAKVTQLCRYGPLTMTLMNLVGNEMLNQESGD